MPSSDLARHVGLHRPDQVVHRADGRRCIALQTLDVSRVAHIHEPVEADGGGEQLFVLPGGHKIVHADVDPGALLEHVAVPSRPVGFRALGKLLVGPLVQVFQAEQVADGDENAAGVARVAGFSQKAEDPPLFLQRWLLLRQQVGEEESWNVSRVCGRAGPLAFCAPGRGWSPGRGAACPPRPGRWTDSGARDT